MRRIVLALLAFLLAGCAEADSANVDEATTAPEWLPMASTDLWTATDWRLDLTTGWGQLKFLSDGSPLRFTVSHDVIDEFTPFADRDGLYGPGAFTAFRLEAEGDVDEFFWLGRDAAFSGPIPYEGASNLAVNAPAGATVLLTVYTNVAGYHLKLGQADEPWASEWRLGEHPALVASNPAPTEDFGIDTGPARVVHRLHWLQELPAQPASAFYAFSFEADFDTVGVGAARAGVADASFYLGPLGGDPGLDGQPFPSFGFGGYFGGGAWRQEASSDVGDWEVSAWRENTDVGTSRTAAGLSVLALPLAPPAA